MAYQGKFISWKIQMYLFFDSEKFIVYIFYIYSLSIYVPTLSASHSSMY